MTDAQRTFLAQFDRNHIMLLYALACLGERVFAPDPDEALEQMITVLEYEMECAHRMIDSHDTTDLKMFGFLVGVEVMPGPETLPGALANKLGDALNWVRGVGSVDVEFLGELDTFPPEPKPEPDPTTTSLPPDPTTTNS